MNARSFDAAILDLLRRFGRPLTAGEISAYAGVRGMRRLERDKALAHLVACGQVQASERAERACGPVRVFRVYSLTLTAGGAP